MTRDFSDVLRVMRLATGRRNENDPDSSDTTMNQYILDFYSLGMPNDLKVYELYTTFEFTVNTTPTDGVYNALDLGLGDSIINITGRGFVSLTTQPTDSASWNRLNIYQNPYDFYQKWGIRNEDVLTPGYPTDLLYYGNQIVVRPIPDQSYTIQIFAYTKNQDPDLENDPDLPYDWWMRYIAYGAAQEYARDYMIDEKRQANIEREFMKQKKRMLTRTHNQLKYSRCIPQF